MYGLDRETRENEARKAESGIGSWEGEKPRPHLLEAWGAV